MKNKGFTLIEVIICIMVLCIIVVPIFDTNLLAFRTCSNTHIKDEEYNITRSICEKFKAETGIVQNKTVVIYINDFDEIIHGLPITNTIVDEISFASSDYVYIRNNNLENKRYAIILNGQQTEYLSVLRVTTLSMTVCDNGISLRIARSL